jgi:putative ABC transport system substrate-binding protein
MRRRELLGALGVAAAVWPLPARAQQRAIPVVGLVHTASPETVADRLRAFRQGLKETGYVEDDNVRIIYRFAENQNNRAPELVADLVRRRVAVIATLNNVSTLAAKATAGRIPVVFSVNEDPVGLGLVESLARPGGNMTGINFLSGELAAKRLELLRELVPGVSRLAVIVDPTNPTNTRTTVRAVEVAAGAMGLKLQLLNASTSQEIDAAFVTLGRDRPDALMVGTDGFFVSRRVQMAILAAKHSIVAFYGNREPTEVGGLISYGTNISDTWRQVGVYAGRVLKGAKPADLPVVQASKFELIINAQTARALGLVVPPSLLARADEVIE